MFSAHINVSLGTMGLYSAHHHRHLEGPNGATYRALYTYLEFCMLDPLPFSTEKVSSQDSFYPS